jgi:uncharacterized protein
MNYSRARDLECASPLAHWLCRAAAGVSESASGLAHPKTLRRAWGFRRPSGWLGLFGALLCCTTGAIAQPFSSATIANGKARVLLVTGVDYPGHVWRQTAPVLAEALRADKRLEVVIVEDPAFLESRAIERYDLILLHFQNWQQPAPGERARENLRKFVEGGKGVALVHFACGAWFGEWPEFGKLAGRAWFGLNPGPGRRQHDPYGPFRVELPNPNHPVVQGMSDFDTQDELYTCLTGDHPIEVLAQAKSKADGKYYPVAFVSKYGKGRTFHCVLGHDVKALSVEGVQELYRRGCAWAAGLAPVAEKIIDLRPGGEDLEVRFKGQKVLAYAFAASQFKPYVRELYTLRGENVLRDAPPDHLHHHGLMYAVNLNGINFWEEKLAPGVQKHVALLAHTTGTNADGLPRAEFTELIHWLAPTNRGTPDTAAAALLIEQRAVTVTIDEPNQEVGLRWDSRFQVGPNVGKLTVHGPNYDGLGLRLPESFNHVARFENSASRAYSGNNTQNVIPAEWTSVSGEMGGREVMLAMFGDQGNASGDAVFFTMLDPFAYLSATQALDRSPLAYSAGEKFRLGYLLTVYSGNKPRDFIQKRFERWQKEQK